MTIWSQALPGKAMRHLRKQLLKPPVACAPFQSREDKRPRQPGPITKLLVTCRSQGGLVTSVRGQPYVPDPMGHGEMRLIAHERGSSKEERTTSRTPSCLQRRARPPWTSECPPKRPFTPNARAQAQKEPEQRKQIRTAASHNSELPHTLLTLKDGGFTAANTKYSSFIRHDGT